MPKNRPSTSPARRAALPCRLDEMDRMVRAMRRAVREALLRHKQAGNPVAVWKDGRVEWVKAKDIPSQ